MGLQTAAAEPRVHKSKKQRRLEAEFDALMGKELRNESPEVVARESSFTDANNFWQLQQQEKQRKLEESFAAEFGKQLLSKEPPQVKTPPAKPKFEKSHRGITVVFLVQDLKNGGAPYRHLEKIEPGKFRTEAECLARQRAKKAGLYVCALIDIIEPKSVVH